MLITIDISENLANRLTPIKGNIPQLLELGLREFNATALFAFKGAAEILEFLARQPTPEETMALRPSENLQAQINVLLEKNRNEGLTLAEEQQWEQSSMISLQRVNGNIGSSSQMKTVSLKWVGKIWQIN